MDKYSKSIDKILNNSEINWDTIIDAAVRTELSDTQKDDIRNLIIATAKIASLTAIKALEDNDQSIFWTKSTSTESKILSTSCCSLNL